MKIMNSCTCKAERECLISRLNVWVDADKEYRDAHDLLVESQIELNALRNRWIDLTCCLTGGLSLWIFALCLAIWLRKFELEDLIEEQEPIVEEKKELRDKAKDDLDIAKKKLGACEDSLKPCAGCEKEFKPACITTCKGCSRDYCNTCFDAGIEAWELKQQENV